MACCCRSRVAQVLYWAGLPARECRGTGARTRRVLPRVPVSGCGCLVGIGTRTNTECCNIMFVLVEKHAKNLKDGNILKFRKKQLNFFPTSVVLRNLGDI
jgi:hypothetical protein